MKTGDIKIMCSSILNKKLFVKDGYIHFQSIKNYVIKLYVGNIRKKSIVVVFKYKIM